MLQTHIKRGVLMAALVLALALTADWTGTGARTVAAGGGQSPAASQPAEKTVDETRKNIQVLKGLPESQLRPLMTLMSASLGVNCSFCHVRNGEQWEYEKDDKKNKQTTRKMIQMTLDINKTNFEGKTEVTCYTCHHNEEHPLSVPSLLRAERRPERAPAQPENLVTPQQVLSKYVEAVGGKEAVEKLKTLVFKGEQVSANGRSAPLEVRFAGQDKMLTIITTPRGAISQALNGARGWMKNDREQRALAGVDLDRLKSLAWSFDPMPLREPYPRLVYGGTEKIGDREAHMLRMTTRDRKRVQFYFDAQTGLLLRRVILTPTILGANPEQTDFEDYREVAGVKIPFTIRTAALDNLVSATRKFTEVKHNEPLDEAQFDMRQ
ncbi:MAG: c-type cytochrome [Blastocatellia bacterium]|nr:c-type cytochrome [Blastocatellia bacterium]